MKADDVRDRYYRELLEATDILAAACLRHAIARSRWHSVPIGSPGRDRLWLEKEQPRITFEQAEDDFMTAWQANERWGVSGAL